MFSVGASKLRDSALKFGEIASQKVVQVSETVGEKMKEGRLLDDVASSVSNVATKVCNYFASNFSSALLQLLI